MGFPLYYSPFLSQMSVSYRDKTWFYAKPQFYFGQTMTDLVKKSSASNGYQTAIDKVKQNEALTHPKRSDEQQKVAAVTELNKKGRHMSIITMAEDKNKDLKGGSSLSSGLFIFYSINICLF